MYLFLMLCYPSTIYDIIIPFAVTTKAHRHGASRYIVTGKWFLSSGFDLSHLKKQLTHGDDLLGVIVMVKTSK